MLVWVVQKGHAVDDRLYRTLLAAQVQYVVVADYSARDRILKQRLNRTRQGGRYLVQCPSCKDLLCAGLVGFHR